MMQTDCTPSDWLNMFYCYCLAVVVSIIGWHGIRIEVSNRNQPSKSKLVLYYSLLLL